MTFSIIIPAHNAAGHIRKALDSIKSQTFKDYELIVVCDSCTDNTEDIAKEYGAITEAVEYHCDGATRNRGLQLATGDWVLFMDDDDWWLHEFVLQQLHSAIGDFDILCFSFIFKDVGYASPRGNGGNYWPACWCKMYRRDKIGTACFSEKTDGTSDMWFFVQMFHKGLRIAEWDMPMYYYNYMRPGSITQERTDQGLQKDFRICRTSP